MPLVFAAAASHAPGITSRPERANPAQKERIYDAYATLGVALRASQPEAVVLFTADHWTNFFLDHITAFCVGRAAKYEGPFETWLRVPRTSVSGEPALATAIIEAAYDQGFEPSFAEELELDHGTMVPLHFLTPDMDLPIVPVMFNALVAPQPSAARCMAFGAVVGDVLRRGAGRVALIAAGGLSHDPNERRHGFIDSDFDRAFLDQMARGDREALRCYSRADFAAAGAGTHELLTWIALSGATCGASGQVIAYEAIPQWATGMGIMRFATDESGPSGSR